MDALLQAVLEDPADDATRLVYADALLAAGDPRGELIVVEHRLQAEADAALRARRFELREAHAATWWPEVATSRFVRTRCGFAEAIALRPRDLGRVAPLLAREPIRELEVYGEPLRADGIARLPGVPRLVARTATTSAVDALLDSPIAAGLESLDLAGAAVHDLDLGDRLPACRRLVLARCGFRLDRLLAWTQLGALQELDISVSAVTGDELATVLARAPDLRCLRASGNPLDDAGGRALARALPQLSKLAHLEILACSLGHTAVDAVRAAAPASLVVHAYRERSTRTIDAFGSTIELVPAPGGWEVLVDAVRRRVAVVFTVTRDGTTTRSSERKAHDVLRGDLLPDAIELGWPRELTDTGVTFGVGTFTASIAMPQQPAPIEVVIDHVVDSADDFESGI